MRTRIVYRSNRHGGREYSPDPIVKRCTSPTWRLPLRVVDALRIVDVAVDRRLLSAGRGEVRTGTIALSVDHLRSDLNVGMK